MMEPDMNMPGNNKTEYDDKIGTSSRPPLLPPCRVCGGNASGLHYGVNTCEACKGFFRRSFSRCVEYSCTGTNDCHILPKKRNNCPACRMKRCLNLGMSKAAIKTGRYTYERRTKYIEEVQTMEAHCEPSQKESASFPELKLYPPEHPVLRGEGETSICTSSYRQYPSPEIKRSPFSVRKKQKLDTELPFSAKNLNRCVPEEAQMLQTKGAVPSSNPVTERSVINANHQAAIEALLSSQDRLIEDLDAFLDEVHMKKRQKDFYKKVATANATSRVDRSRPSSVTADESSSKEGILDIRLQNSAMQNNVVKEKNATTKHSATQNSDSCSVKDRAGQENIAGKRKAPLNPSPFPRTNLEIKRIEQMDKVAELMDSEFRNIISFIKAIPGWKSLEMEDQINLIKDGAAELWILGHCQCIDAELGVFTGEYDMTFQVAASMWTDVYVESVYKTSVMFNKLKLSKEELVVLKTIVLTYPDRCQMVCRDAVEKVQWHMVECLEYVCIKNGIDFNKRFASITDALIIARDMTAKFKEIVKTVVCQWSIFEKFPLLNEFFNSY